MAKRPPRKPTTKPKALASAKTAEGAELADLYAEIERLRSRLSAAELRPLVTRARQERTLRKTGNPYKALAEGGVKKPGVDTENRTGTKWGRSPRELKRLRDLYVNMTSAPGPCRPQYARTPERLDLLLANAIDCFDAKQEGKPVPPIPAEAVFVPNCDVPMSKADALVNVAEYADLEPRTAWDRLRDAGLRPRIDLPPQP